MHKWPAGKGHVDVLEIMCAIIEVMKNIQEVKTERKARRIREESRRDLELCCLLGQSHRLHFIFAEGALRVSGSGGLCE